MGTNYEYSPTLIFDAHLINKEKCVCAKEIFHWVILYEGSEPITKNIKKLLRE